MLLGFLKALAFAIGMVLVSTIIGVLMGYPAALWISQKMANFLSFFPTEKLRKPLPLMGQASALAMSGDVRGAAEKYEEFLIDFPEMKELYLCLIELAVGPMQDEDYADDIIARGVAHLEYDSDRRALIRHAEAIRNRHLIPLKHLQWCELPEVEHPDVMVPELVKGRLLKPQAN